MGSRGFTKQFKNKKKTMFRKKCLALIQLLSVEKYQDVIVSVCFLIIVLVTQRERQIDSPLCWQTFCVGEDTAIWDK